MFLFAPRVEWPLSGDVIQDIEPRVFSPDISGDAETEYRIHRNVASYGKQLGKILEALELLAKASDIDMESDEIKAITDLRASVEAEKDDHRATLRRQAEDALAALKEVDEQGWQDVRTWSP